MTNDYYDDSTAYIFGSCSLSSSTVILPMDEEDDKMMVSIKKFIFHHLVERLIC
jgi:hypothetical protein